LSPRRKTAAEADDSPLVRPDGLAVRRRRHDNGWSPRELVVAIEAASFKSSGLRQTLTPPIDLIAEGEFSSRRTERRLN